MRQIRLGFSQNPGRAGDETATPANAPALWSETPKKMEPPLLRGDAHFRRRGAHVGVDVLLELHEVLLEHADQLARGLVELELVLPGFLRIEQVRLDAGELGRHGE